jgi:hypothetical protein
MQRGLPRKTTGQLANVDLDSHFCVSSALYAVRMNSYLLQKSNLFEKLTLFNPLPDDPFPWI